MINDSWPFADPPNVVSFTLRQIMDGEAPILLVCRDAEDGTWQFLDGNTVSMDDALLVALSNVYAIDESIGKLADLQVGWQAARESKDDSWVIEREA